MTPFSRAANRLSPKLRLMWIQQWANGLVGRSPGMAGSSSESGLTLIECIVAIVIISIVGVAITPPLFLATAARVQTNRAEQAVQISQGEVDKVRVLVEQGAYDSNDLPGPGAAEVTKTPSPNSVLENALSSTHQPCDDTLDSNFSPPAANELLPVDVNGDCQSDFLIQVFRSQDNPNTLATTASGETIPLVFGLGVRVWVDTPALRNNLAALDPEPAELTITAGTGEQTIKPLAVAYTRIARSDLNVSYRTFCLSLGGTEDECK
ncbi:MAG: prepilin-type N-terminal cleavage/methylation domain-containing protein [Cyanobacteria bacterium P01_D01_bin.73]